MEYKTRVVGRRELGKFIDFPEKLYAGDDKYTPFMRGALRKNLKKLLFKDKSYTALVTEDENGAVLARVLFTIDRNKQLKTERCGFFSLYECVDDPDVSRQLLTAMEELMRRDGAEYISGAYWPFDQDNRRGILCRGFETAPLIFTSYNPPYYNDQMLAFGMEKQTDAYEYVFHQTEQFRARLSRLAAYSRRRCAFHVDPVDLRRPDRDIRDLHEIMESATTEIIYQDAPGVEELYAILHGWRRFLWPELILIARRDSDEKPLGASVCLPDFFELFRRMRGRMDPRGICAYLRYRKKIKSIRGILQYVIPEYQSRGVILALYEETLKAADRRGIEYIEVGTIMEANAQSNGVAEAAGAELCKVYRLYYKKL